MKFEAWVPGRIEFLGKHTDYAGGRSLLCPIDRGIRLTAASRADTRITVTDTRLRETIECTLDPHLEPPRGHWANYSFTVARRIARDFPDARIGVDIEFESDLPLAAGMSSSSALIISVYVAIAAANRLNEHLNREQLAEYLGGIEGGADGAGALIGCQDQTAIVCGRPEQLVQYSFCPVRYEAAYPIPDAYDFVIAASGVVAEKTAGTLAKYNSLARKAAAAAEAWRRASGRTDATLGDAVAHASAAEIRAAIADPDLVDRFDQFYAESEVIIPAAGQALATHDLTALGKRVDDSQRGAEQLLRNQVAETTHLARSARELGASAASAFGAGFGGSVWALIPSSASEGFLKVWQDTYLRRFPAHQAAARFFITRAASGMDLR